MNDTTASLVIVGEELQDESLAGQLALDGYAVRTAGDRLQLRALAESGPVDLILLGAGARAGEREHLVRAVRDGELAPQLEASARVLWLAGADQTAELLRAFRAGADDVARADCAYDELQARVQALLARGRAREQRLLRHEALSIDTAAREVRFGSLRVELRRQEYALLLYLARDPHRVFAKRELLREVWGFRSSASTRTLALHASRLRRKLARVGAGAGWITSVWGVGYRLAPAVAEEFEPPPAGAGARVRSRPWPPPALHASRASRTANGPRPAGRAGEGES
jgi:two-component system response regulator MtrA